MAATAAAAAGIANVNRQIALPQTPPPPMLHPQASIDATAMPAAAAVPSSAVALTAAQQWELKPG